MSWCVHIYIYRGTEGGRERERGFAVSTYIPLQLDVGPQENEIPGALAILQLLQSEISIWSYGRIATTPRPRPIKRRMRYVLERMSLSGLVSLVCTNVSGKFPKLLSNELKALRETARLVRAAN